MTIFLGSDHNGYDLKRKVANYLSQQGYEVVDKGDEQQDPSDDFPVFASRVVHAMRAEGDHSKGILICGSGQGMVIAANRFKGIRAGLGWSVEAARGIRHDEDSNLLALPASVLKHDDQWQPIIDTWLKTPFANAARFRRRNAQLDELA